MAYTITQKPTTPNAAYTRLMYTVSGSTNTAKPQFQYMMDVFESGSTSLIKRSFQTINPAGVANFDPARIIQGELSQDNSWKISSLTPFENSSKVFTLKFGETYATSISSSAVIVDDVQQTNTEVFRGVVQPNNGISYNWQSSSYAALSNMPATMSMQNNDYGTISVYKNGITSVTNNFYGNDTIITTSSYSVTDNFSSVPISSSLSWDYVEVNVSSSLGKESYRFNNTTDGNREKVRFAFINKLGTWDYFNNYNPVKQFIDVKREQYTAPRVDYSNLSSTYDIERRGLKDYHNSTDDEFTTETDYLDKTNANWLEELIESPSVYIQRNGELLPIVITDSSYTANTNQARQKLFQYTINFKPSNQPFGTWIPEYVSCSSNYKAFSPYAGGIASSSLLYWYDFTNPESMTISGSNQINAIGSKGLYTASLSTGSSAKYGSNWKAPTLEYGYTQFYGEPDNTNSTLASVYGNSQFLPGFSAKDITTTIYFAKVAYTDPGPDSLIGFRNDKSIQPNSASNHGDFNILSIRNDATLAAKERVDYFSTTESNLKANGPRMAERVGSSSALYYSYNGKDPSWQSTFMRYAPTNYVNNKVNLAQMSASRAPGERLASSSLDIYDTQTGAASNEGFAIGGTPNSASLDSADFKLAHFLMYTGSLTNEQITAVITSFTGSVGYGNEVNAISN